MNLLAAVRAVFRGDPCARQQERIEKAIKARAHAAADVEYERVMADYYTDLTMATDPWKDHFGFCQAREKQLSHQREWELAQRMLATKQARVNAEEARLLKLAGV